MKQKKFLSMVLILAILFSMAGGMQTAGAASSEGDFIFNSSTGTITGLSSTTTGGAIEIPSTIGGVAVTAIGASAFRDCSTLTGITIPGSVESIGDSAFWNCVNLTSITIQNGVKTIDSFAFGQTAIQSIILPDSVESIGDNAFYGCTQLTSAVLSESITTIPYQLFEYCENLKQIIIPDKVTSIGSYAFGDCSALADVDMPAGLQKIEYCAFSTCTKLKSIRIPAGVTDIGSGAFTECTALEAMYFEGNAPATMTGILSDVNSSVFRFYYKAESTGFVENLNGYQTEPLYRISIDTASGGSLSVGTVTGANLDSTWVETGATVNLNALPDAGMQLKGGSLKYNNGLDHPITGTSFSMPADEVKVSAEFMPAASTTYRVDVETMIGGSIAINLTNAAPDEIINLTISPDQGKQLKEGTLKYTFNGAKYTINGTSFVMPAGGVSISAEFETCDYTFDVSTGTIKGYTGAGGDIVIPSAINGVRVKVIAANAFKGCTTITSVIVPEGVTSIGNGAFDECRNMTAITIPDGVVSIGDNAFTDCNSLESVTFPDSVTSMGVGVFYYCYDLTSVKLPAGITEIPGSTFIYCDSLTDVSIPDSITSIGEGAFDRCESLRSIRIPAGVDNIKNNAFAYCKSLELAIFTGNAPTSFGTDVFKDVSENFKILYPSGSTGFTTPTWQGYSSSVYVPGAKYTVTYDTNGADTGSVPNTVAALETGDSITVSGNTGSIVKAGYKFDGWNTAADGSGVDYTADGVLIVAAENVTLYAKWETAYKITIEPVQHGSIVADTAEAIEGEWVLVTVVPEEGWRLKYGSLKYNDGTKDYVLNGKDSEPYNISSKASADGPGMPRPPFPSENEYSFKMPAANVTITAEFEDSSIDYSFDEATGTILKYVGSDANVIIPSEIKGVPVVRIGVGAFEYKYISGVTIPEGVTAIEERAFNGCSHLCGVTLPGTLTTIGLAAFEYCYSLVSIKIPDGVDTIGGYAFYGTQNLRTVYFEGNAPATFGSAVFGDSAGDIKVLYNSGKGGFGTKLFGVYNTLEIQSLDSAAAVEADRDELDILYAYTLIPKPSDPKEGINIGKVNPYVFETADTVKNNLYLSVVGEVYGSDITWSSSNTEVIGNDGKVTRPVASSGDTNVKLTATISNNGLSDTKEFDLVVLKQEKIIYTVTFDSNYGSTPTSTTTMAAISGESLGTLPAAPTRTGYTFTGWNTAANGSGTVFTAATAVNGSMTVYAQWRVNTVSSNEDATKAIPAVTVAETSEKGNGKAYVTGTITTEAKSDSNGKAGAAVTESQMTEAVNKAVEAAAKKGEGTAAKVEIKVTAPVDAKAVETSIPKTAVLAVSESKADALKVSTPIAEITFDKNALSTISKEAAGDVNVTVSKIDTATLPEETRQAVGDRPVFDFGVTSGSKAISQFGGNVEVSIPYTPKSGEDKGAIVIYYINEAGKLEMVSNCVYDPATGKINFRTNHFSKYAVGYNKVNFSDVAASAWYSQAVSFVAARGITTGTGNGNFSPEAKLTRAQFLVMVMKAYGIKADENPKDNFADAGNTYYTGYLAAAKRLGITVGVGDNKYAPDTEVTRQEMFTLLYNILKMMNQLPEGNTGKELSAYTDSDTIASWAKEAMTLFVNTETISGSGGKLSPTDTTNRAQMAQILYKLLSK